MKKLLISIVIVVAVCGCSTPVQSISGTKMATVDEVTLNSKGNTVEQQNIIDRVAMDNKPGSIKHLYVISAYSGQVLIYSTVRGKVTSSGKRLTPSHLGTGENSGGFKIEVGGHTFLTDEILGEDGTFGSSVEYLYWWDSKGVYHQHYIQGGQILHISDQPISAKTAVINMEISGSIQP